MEFFDYENSPPLRHLIGKEEHRLAILSLGLTEEAGEVAGKIKKMLRNDDGVVTPVFVDNVKKELGDVLWYLTKLGHHFGMSLEDIAQTNIDKLSARMEKGTIKGEGDHR